MSTAVKVTTRKLPQTLSTHLRLSSTSPQLHASQSEACKSVRAHTPTTHIAAPLCRYYTPLWGVHPHNPRILSVSQACGQHTTKKPHACCMHSSEHRQDNCTHVLAHVQAVDYMQQLPRMQQARPRKGTAGLRQPQSREGCHNATTRYKCTYNMRDNQQIDGCCPFCCSQQQWHVLSRT